MNLVNGNHISVARAAALMAAMFGLRASTGFVAGAHGKAAARLGAFLDRGPVPAAPGRGAARR